MEFLSSIRSRDPSSFIQMPCCKVACQKRTKKILILTKKELCWNLKPQRTAARGGQTIAARATLHNVELSYSSILTFSQLLLCQKPIRWSDSDLWLMKIEIIVYWELDSNFKIRKENCIQISEIGSIFLPLCMRIVNCRYLRCKNWQQIIIVWILP